MRTSPLFRALLSFRLLTFFAMSLLIENRGGVDKISRFVDIALTRRFDLVLPNFAELAKVGCEILRKTMREGVPIWSHIVRASGAWELVPHEKLKRV